MEISLTVLSHLADVSVRAVLLLMLASASLWLGRGKSASVRHGAWTLVVGGMLLLLFVGPLLPPLPLRVLPAETALAVPVAPTAEVAQYVALTQPETPSMVAAPVPRRWAPSWPQVLFLAYAAGVLISLARLLYGYRFVRRLVHEGRPVERAWSMPCLDRLSAGRRVELLESDRISVPLTAGWSHPKILLPAEWREWSEAKTEAVLTHELCHVARADWLVALLAGLDRCVFWFHPQAWWLERKLTSLAEEACDDESLLYLENREQYAQALVDMAAAIRPGQGRLLWEAMAIARQSHVRARVERILDRARRISRGLTPRRWAAALACSLPVVLMASALQLAPVESQRKVPWILPLDKLKLDTEAYGLKPADIEDLERRLVTNPEDLNARALLLSRYFQFAEHEPLQRHISWVIEHHPESDLAGFSLATFPPLEGQVTNPAYYETERSMWLQQIARHWDDARVLGNAARFFSQRRIVWRTSDAQPGPTGSKVSVATGDLDEVERLLKRARTLEPDQSKWTDQLAGLYASVLTATAVNPANRSFWMSPGMEDEKFAARITEELQSSTDGPLLLSVGSRLTVRARITAKNPGVPFPWPDSPELKAVTEFGERLLKRAEQSGLPR